VAQHVLYLTFIGSSVTCESGFELEGSGFYQGDILLGYRENNDTTGMGNGNGCLLIGRKKQLFHNRKIRFCFVDECGEISCYFYNPLWEGGMGIRRNRQPFEDRDIVHILRFNEAEADRGESRIDAEDAHEGMIGGRAMLGIDIVRSSIERSDFLGYNERKT